MPASKKVKKRKVNKKDSKITTIDNIKIHCLYDELIDPLILKPHPANPNKHPEPQVTLLSKIMKKNGIRQSITISKRSGYIVSGHCRCLSAMLLELKEYPVTYQDFESESEELAVLVADNKIAELAEIDGSKMGDIIVELDQVNYPLELTALNESQIQYYIEGPIYDDPAEHWNDMPEFEQVKKEGFRTLIVHFIDQNAVNDFCNLINQQLTEKTKYIWYPKQEKESFKDKEYIDEK